MEILILILIFVLGYLVVALEHKLVIDKSIATLFMASAMWAYVAIAKVPLINSQQAENALMHHLMEISGILFFLIGAMKIVSVMDERGSLNLIQPYIKSISQTKMMWKVMIITFFLSAVLDNLTTTIVIITILMKIIKKRGDLIAIACLVIVAANAGGAWSPIGDVTTTMLWAKGKISTTPLFLHTFLPSVAMASVTPIAFTFWPSLLNNLTKGLIETKESKKDIEHVEHYGKKTMLWVGILALLFVPIFKTLTHLPPFLGMLFSASTVMLVNEFYNRKVRHNKEHKNNTDKYSITYHHILKKVEWNTILFFLGILLAVGVFQSVSIGNVSSLVYSAQNLKEILPLSQIGVIFGIVSAIIDNVPLVDAAQGMFPEIQNDHWFWHFIAYTAGTGGSMIIIGSAAGVMAQSMLKIEFMWYIKRISPIVFLSFMAGVCIFFLQIYLFL